MDEKKISPIKAIRQNCIECCCGDKNEVKLCPVEGCPLYPFRLGHNPYIKRELTEEQKKAAAERMAAYHAKNKENKE